MLCRIDCAFDSKPHLWKTHACGPLLEWSNCTPLTESHEFLMTSKTYHGWLDLFVSLNVELRKDLWMFHWFLPHFWRKSKISDPYRKSTNLCLHFIVWYFFYKINFPVTSLAPLLLGFAVFFHAVLQSEPLSFQNIGNSPPK